MTNSQYKSPAHKLIKFFKKSRDNWKAKAQAGKKKIRSLAEMLRKLRHRRDELQAQIKTLRQQVSDMEKQLQNLANGHKNTLKKKRLPVIIEQKSDQIQPQIAQKDSSHSNSHQHDTSNSLVPVNHHYDARTISMANELVATACLSFRAAGKSLSIIEKYLPIEVPSMDSIRQWVYRLGYYELLEQPKPVRSDWVFIADFTASIGTHKCLVVLGIPLKKLKQCKWHLTHQEVTLLGLELWNHSNGKKVDKCLEEISNQVGVPIQIVADGGSDLNKGVKLFCERHPKTTCIYDISHKLARLLEKHLKDDEDWNLFVKSVSKAKAQSQQTPLSCLTPPTLRTKARYMNLHTMTRWAVRILKYRENDNFEALDLGFGFDEIGVNNLVPKIEIQLDEVGVSFDGIEINKLVKRLQELVTSNPGEDRDHFHDKLAKILEPKELDNLEQIIFEAANIGRTKFEEIFGCLVPQSSAINLYSTLLQMVETVEEKLKTKGLNRRTVASCNKQIKKLGNCERSMAFGCEVTKFLEQQLIQVPKGKTYLASTDIVESLIGKFKFLNHKANVYEINQSVLLFGTITAKITPEKVKTAMEAVPWTKVKQWIKEKIPVSNLAKRCKTLFHDRIEQKSATTLPAK